MSKPIVPYRETVQAESSIVALAKSQNKHNRLFVKATPIDDVLTQAIEDGKVNARDEIRARARLLADEYGWDVTEARKIWCFGPDMSGANLLVDATKGVQYMQEIKDSCSGAFQWATKGGVICEETMRGIRVNILDAVVSNLRLACILLFTLFCISSTGMPSIAEVVNLCPPCAERYSPPAYWQSRLFKSPFTLVNYLNRIISTTTDPIPAHSGDSSA